MSRKTASRKSNGLGRVDSVGRVSRLSSGAPRGMAAPGPRNPPRRRSSNLELVAAPAAPTLELWGVQPTQARVAGGTLLWLFGKGFPPNSEVWIGSQTVAAQIVKVQSSGDVAVVTPPGVAEPVPIMVRDPLTGKQSVKPDAFVYGGPGVLP